MMVKNSIQPTAKSSIALIIQVTGKLYLLTEVPMLSENYCKHHLIVLIQQLKYLPDLEKMAQMMAQAILHPSLSQQPCALKEKRFTLLTQLSEL